MTQWFKGVPHSSASYGFAAMYLGACGAINTIPISPMAPVWASHGLLNTTCPARENPNIHLLLSLHTHTLMSPRGGHQDKQLMPMTDPRQTEDNYGNGVLKDTESLKPTSPLQIQQALSCSHSMLWGVCVCVRVCEMGGGLLCECQAGPASLMCPLSSFNFLCNCTRGCWVN